jgi:hypothetical protein
VLPALARGLVQAKRRNALADSELIATYIELTAGRREVIKAHVSVVGQLASFIADGIGREEVKTSNPTSAARAVFDATARFHDSVHAAE